MPAWVVALLLLFACDGSHANKERRACERAITLCGYDEGMDACLKGMGTLKAGMGRSYDKFLDCSGAATTCEEHLGCSIEALTAEGLVPGTGRTTPALDGPGTGLPRP